VGYVIGIVQIYQYDTISLLWKIAIYR
jgi:hypothetical protein